MENNIRIPMNVLRDDQRITVKLEQEFDNLETLSLTITSSEAYSRMSSDFGVICGRCVLNNGFGGKLFHLIPTIYSEVKDGLQKVLYNR